MPQETTEVNRVKQKWKEKWTNQATLEPINEVPASAGENIQAQLQLACPQSNGRYN